MPQKYPMTPAGKKELEEKLVYLKEVKLKGINDEVKRLRGFCDFLDDTAFKDTLTQQYLVEDQIKLIEDMLYNSELISPKGDQAQGVTIGSTVTFMEIPGGDQETYTIVGAIEANPIENKISMESPIGKSLLGSTVNDIIFIEIPSGKIKVKIIDLG